VLYLITTLILRLKYIRISTNKNVDLKLLKAYYLTLVKDIYYLFSISLIILISK